jgi:hypothetical protein
MKTFKQYISEAGTWGSSGQWPRGPLSPWLPYPNSGGKNVVTPGSIKPPKNRPERFSKHGFWEYGGRIISPDFSDYPDTQAPPPGVAREWPDDVTLE